MPELKDKNSRLNPSQEDFDSIVNRPDMQALNDQGDTIARDLKNSETDTGPRKPADKPESVKAAEKSSDTTENPYGYQKPEPSQRKSSKIANWSRRRKAAAIGGGAAGLGGILIAFFMLLPLKIPGIMSMIAGEAGQRVEQITERRAGMIMSRAILNKFGKGDGVVLTGGPFSSLVASMRTKGFEKKLANRGLVIERNSAGKVTLTMKGERLGTFKNEVEIDKALRANALTNKMLKDVIKEEIPSWRWMKRAKFASWLRFKYGIPRFGITNSKEADPEKATAEMETERRKIELGRTIKNATGLLLCVLSGGSGCTDLDGKTFERPVAATTSSGEEVASTLEGSGDDAIASSGGSTDVDVGETMFKNFGTKIAGGASIIGLIDLASIVNHAIRSEVESGFLGKAVATMKEQNFAQLYGSWEGYSSQNQLGALRPDYLGKLDAQLVDSEGRGIETSQAFNYIAENTAAGADKGIPGVPVDKIGANDPSYVQQKLKVFDDNLGGLAGVLAFGPSAFLELWYDTIGKGISAVLGKFGSFLGAIFGALTPDQIQQKVMELATKLAGAAWQFILEFFDLDYSPFVEGPTWFNNTHGGATASYNRFCKESGCRKLTSEQAGVQNQVIATERSQYRTDQGVLYAIFSGQEPSSLTNRVAINMPDNPSSILNKAASLIAAMPATILGNAIPSTSADSGYVDLYGVDPYGAASADLNQPLSEEFIKGEPCPEVAEGDYDNCKIDTLVAEAMLCEYEPETEGCGDEAVVDTITDNASEFTVASYNILHKQFRGNYVERTEKQVKIITGNAGMGNPQFDILGTQETSPEQFNLLKSSLPGYDAFPKNTDGMHPAAGAHGSLGLFWNTAKFKMIENGHAPARSNINEPITAPWVGLQSNSGQKVYAISVHYATASRGGTPENIKAASRLTMDWVRSKVGKNSIVVVVGDFNDRLGEDLSYCVYTENSLMQHAVDMEASANPDAGCSADRYGGIDHVYATPQLDLTVKNWRKMPANGIVAQASDHTPAYAIYSLPSKGSGVVGDWSWPVDKKWWLSNKADLLGAHTADSGTWTNGIDRLAVDIGDPPDGSPVYAMIGGSVSQADLNSSVGGPHGLAIKTEVQGGTLEVAYAHGPRTNREKTYQSGDRISSIGCLGNCDGGHLHIDIAFNGKGICPQDIFIALGAGKEPDLNALTKKAVAPCGRF